MRNSINVSSIARVQSLMGLIGEVSPLVANVIRDTMKAQHQAAWLEYCYNECEISATVYYGVALRCINIGLNPKTVADILDRHEMAIRHMEVAQYDQLDGDDQYNQDLLWEKSDEQSDFDDKLNMYYNEC